MYEILTKHDSYPLVLSAKGDMKEEVFKEFIREVQQAPNDFQAVPLQEEDRLKLRAKYSSAVSSDKERAKKHVS